MLRIAALACMLAATTVAFSFNLPAKKTRCFTEELPTGALFSLAFVAAPGYAQYIDVKVTDSHSQLVWEETASDHGTLKYSVRPGQGGDFAICFYSRMVPGMKYQEGMKRAINLDFKVNSDMQDYDKIATKEHLKPMEVNLRIMEDVIRSVHGEYLYYRDREVTMRDSNEHLNARVMWATVVMMSIIALFGWWQVRHLKHFFRRKRMID